MLGGIQHLKTLNYEQIKCAVLKIATKPNYITTVKELSDFRCNGNEDPILYANKLKKQCSLATDMHNKEFNFESYLISGLTKNMNEIKRDACMILLQDTPDPYKTLEYIANIFEEKGKIYFFDPPKQLRTYWLCE